MRLTRVHLAATRLRAGILAAVPAASGVETQRLIERDFMAFDPAYKARRVLAGERLQALAERLAAVQATGNAMACSNQIFLESKCLYPYTADWPRLEAGLDRPGEAAR